MVGEVTEKTCLGQCHNENNPMKGEKYLFDFATRKADGLHKMFPLKYQHE